MKFFLTFLILLAITSFALAAATTMTAQANGNTYSIELTQNGNNTDAALTIKANMSTWTADMYGYLYCINTVNTDYTIASGTTGLSAFMFGFQCDSTCTDSSHLFAGTFGAEYLVTSTATVTAGGSYDTTALMGAISGLSLSASSNTTAVTSTVSVSNMTEAQLTAAILPNSSSASIPYRCYSATSAGVANFATAAVTGIQTTLSTSNNVTLRGANSYGIGAGLASLLTAAVMLAS